MNSTALANVKPTVNLSGVYSAQPARLEQSATQLVVIDAGVVDYTTLADGTLQKAAVLILPTDQDGIAQLTEALRFYPSLRSLHLICHGAPGCLYLGNTQLNLDTIAHYAPLLQRWFDHPESQLLLYGCNVAAGDAGSEFIDRLHQLMGVAIAASTTPIGSAKQGGNWQLDVTTDAMAVPSCFREAVMQSYGAVLAAGDLDTSFGTGGIVIGSAGSNLGTGLQSEGKLLVTSSISGSSSSYILSRYNSNGSLDTSFGSGGSVTGINNSGEDILIQPDGKIIVAGDTPDVIPYLPSGARSFSVTRYNSDGSLDTGFGNSGTSITHIGSPVNDQFSAALQSDGKILLGGYSFYTGSDSAAALIRYNSNGSLDTSFGNGGIVTATIPDQRRSYASSIAVQADGQIVVAGGSAMIVEAPSLVLWKFNPNGTLLDSTKTSFTSVGSNRIPFISSPKPNTPQVAVQTDGKIVIAQDLAYNQPGRSSLRYTLVRFNSDFTLDSSFGTGGLAVGRFQNELFPYDPSTTINYGDLTLQSDGKIVTAGKRDQNGVSSFILERYNSNGSPDNSFGAGGGVLTNFGTGSASASNLVIQPDGKVVATGTANGSFVLVRYDGISSGVNQAPTDLGISFYATGGIYPQQGVTTNYKVGSLSTIDPDGNDLHSYTLVAGAGDTDNALFYLQSRSDLYLSPAVNPTSKPSYSVRVRADDGRGGTVEKVLTLPVINLAPSVSAPIGDKAATSGTPFSLSVANTFTDPNPGDTFTLSASLSNGNPLPTWLSFNPTTGLFSGTPNSSDGGTQLIQLKAIDQAGASNTAFFNLTVLPSSNQLPTDLSLSNTSIVENSPSGTVLGTLTTVDPNVGDTFTYSLVSGTGATNNAAFTLVGNSLRTTQAFNFESKSSYSIRVRTDDGKGGSFEKALTLNVLDVNEAPIAGTAIANQTTTAGTAFSYTVPGTTLTDPDAGDVLTLSATLSDGSFLPGWLTFNPLTRTFSGTPTSTNVGTLNLLVKASDRAGLSTTTGFNLSVANASTNQAPTNLSLSSTRVAENLASGAIVGTFSTTDPNASDTFTYTLVAGTGSADNAGFTIVGNTLRTTRAFNFEAKASYKIRIRTTDSSGSSFEKALTITIQDINDAPIVTTPLTNKTATVGTAFRFIVPTNTFFDEDANANDDLDWLTLSATLSNGSALPGWLKFNASTGTFSGTPTSGNVGSLNLLVKAKDQSGAFVTTAFTLTVR